MTAPPTTGGARPPVGGGARPVIEISGLRKEFRRLRGAPRPALAGIDLEVPEGGVFGFLGPNGSGKTTTIRCLLGLARPSGGSARLFGLDVPDRLPDVLGRVGAIVEAPALFPTLTGRANLALLGRLQGIGADAVGAALERVGLADRADEAVRTYSLGMRQRLGLACALLRDPALLVLDEPANGLDPSGIREIRELIRSLGDEGRTVFVSSHQLGEVQQMCDRVAILARGRCLVAGSVEEVLASGRRSEVVVGVDDRRRALAVLASAGFEARNDGRRLTVLAGADQSVQINRLLGAQGLWPFELRATTPTLEEVFLTLTNGDDRSEPAPDGVGHEIEQGALR